MHLHFLKAGPGFQYILNIITVAGSANADADATLRAWTRIPKNPQILSLISLPPLSFSFWSSLNAV